MLRELKLFKNSRREWCLRFLAALTTVIFAFSSAVTAQPPIISPATAQSPREIALPNRLHLPSDLGSIQHEYRAETGKPFIIYIQDAHAIWDAQNNIQGLIQYFQEKFGVRLIAVEGGTGKMDPTLLRSFPDEFVKKKVLSKYLNRGELSGADMAAVFSPKAGTYYGIEDWDLYQANYLAYLGAMQNQEKALQKLRSLKADLDQSRKQLYSSGLNEFHEQVEAFQAEKTQLIELLKSLKGKIPLKPYPHLETLSRALDENSAPSENLDLSIRQMAKAFQKKYASRLEKAKAMEFQGKFQAYTTGQMEPGRFLQFLLEAGKSLGLKPKLNPSMQALLNQSETLSMIKGTKLFDELEEALKKTEAGLIQTPEEKELTEKYRQVRLMKELANLELTRDQWEELQASSVAKLFSPALEFYRLALERDKMFLQNLTTLIQKEKARSAIVLTGGFHAKGFEENLKKQGYSYVVIAPKIRSLAGQEMYQGVMRGKLSYREYLKTTYYDAFVRHATIKLMSALNEPDFRRNFKLWRDQVLRELSREGRITEARKYTSYIDLLLKTYHDKFGIGKNVASREQILKAIEGELERFRKDTVTNLWQRFQIQFKEFSDGLRALLERKELTFENISGLLDRVQQSRPSVFASPGALFETPILKGMRGEEIPPQIFAVPEAPLGRPIDLQRTLADIANEAIAVPENLRNNLDAAMLAVELENSVRNTETLEPSIKTPEAYGNYVRQKTEELAEKLGITGGQAARLLLEKVAVGGREAAALINGVDISDVSLTNDPLAEELGQTQGPSQPSRMPSTTPLPRSKSSLSPLSFQPEDNTDKKKGQARTREERPKVETGVLPFAGRAEVRSYTQGEIELGKNRNAALGFTFENNQLRLTLTNKRTGQTISLPEKIFYGNEKVRVGTPPTGRNKIIINSEFARGLGIAEDQLEFRFERTSRNEPRIYLRNNDVKSKNPIVYQDVAFLPQDGWIPLPLFSDLPDYQGKRAWVKAAIELLKLEGSKVYWAKTGITLNDIRQILDQLLEQRKAEFAPAIANLDEVLMLERFVLSRGLKLDTALATYLRDFIQAEYDHRGITDIKRPREKAEVKPLLQQPPEATPKEAPAARQKTEDKDEPTVFGLSSDVSGIKIDRPDLPSNIPDPGKVPLLEEDKGFASGANAVIMDAPDFTIRERSPPAGATAEKNQLREGPQKRNLGWWVGAGILAALITAGGVAYVLKNSQPKTPVPTPAAPEKKEPGPGRSEVRSLGLPHFAQTKWLEDYNQRTDRLNQSVRLKKGFALDGQGNIYVIPGSSNDWIAKEYLLMRVAAKKADSDIYTDGYVPMPYETNEQGEKVPAVYQVENEKVVRLNLQETQDRLGLSIVLGADGTPLTIKGFVRSTGGKVARVFTMPGPFDILLNKENNKVIRNLTDLENIDPKMTEELVSVKSAAPISKYRDELIERLSKNGKVIKQKSIALEFKGTGSLFRKYLHARSERGEDKYRDVEDKFSLIIDNSSFKEGFGFAGWEEDLAKGRQDQIREKGGQLNDVIISASRLIDRTELNQGRSRNTDSYVSARFVLSENTLRLDQLSKQTLLPLLAEKYPGKEETELIRAYLYDVAYRLGRDARAVQDSGLKMSGGGNDYDNYTILGLIADSGTLDKIGQDAGDYIRTLQSLLSRIAAGLGRKDLNDDLQETFNDAYELNTLKLKESRSEVRNLGELPKQKREYEVPLNLNENILYASLQPKQDYIEFYIGDKPFRRKNKFLTTLSEKESSDFATQQFINNQWIPMSNILYQRFADNVTSFLYGLFQALQLESGNQMTDYRLEWRVEYKNRGDADMTMLIYGPQQQLIQMDVYKVIFTEKNGQIVESITNIGEVAESKKDMIRTMVFLPIILQGQTQEVKDKALQVLFEGNPGERRTIFQLQDSRSELRSGAPGATRTEESPGKLFKLQVGGLEYRLNLQKLPSAKGEGGKLVIYTSSEEPDLKKRESGEYYDHYEAFEIDLENNEIVLKISEDINKEFSFQTISFTHPEENPAGFKEGKKIAARFSTELLRYSLVLQRASEIANMSEKESWFFSDASISVRDILNEAGVMSGQADILDIFDISRSEVRQAPRKFAVPEIPISGRSEVRANKNQKNLDRAKNIYEFERARPLSTADKSELEVILDRLNHAEDILADVKKGITKNEQKQKEDLGTSITGFRQQIEARWHDIVSGKKPASHVAIGAYEKVLLLFPDKELNQIKKALEEELDRLTGSLQTKSLDNPKDYGELAQLVEAFTSRFKGTNFSQKNPEDLAILLDEFSRLFSAASYRQRIEPFLPENPDNLLKQFMNALSSRAELRMQTPEQMFGISQAATETLEGSVSSDVEWNDLALLKQKISSDDWERLIDLLRSGESEEALKRNHARTSGENKYRRTILFDLNQPVVLGGRTFRTVKIKGGLLSAESKKIKTLPSVPAGQPRTELIMQEGVPTLQNIKPQPLGTTLEELAKWEYYGTKYAGQKGILTNYPVARGTYRGRLFEPTGEKVGYFVSLLMDSQDERMYQTVRRRIETAYQEKMNEFSVGKILSKEKSLNQLRLLIYSLLTKMTGILLGVAWWPRFIGQALEKAHRFFIRNLFQGGGEEFAELRGWLNQTFFDYGEALRNLNRFAVHGAPHSGNVNLEEGKFNFQDNDHLMPLEKISPVDRLGHLLDDFYLLLDAVHEFEQTELPDGRRIRMYGNQQAGMVEFLKTIGVNLQAAALRGYFQNAKNDERLQSMLVFENFNSSTVDRELLTIGQPLLPLGFPIKDTDLATASQNPHKAVFLYEFYKEIFGTENPARSEVRLTDIEKGLCVTGDTLLPVIREQGTGDRGQEIPITEVKPGDYVFSLNESIGQIEPRRVLAFLDMGVKPVYKLTTASGRSIKTTANHPYLVRGQETRDMRQETWGRDRGNEWVKVSELKAGDEIAVANQFNGDGYAFAAGFPDTSNRTPPLKKWLKKSAFQSFFTPLRRIKHKAEESKHTNQLI